MHSGETGLIKPCCFCIIPYRLGQKLCTGACLLQPSQTDINRERFSETDISSENEIAIREKDEKESEGVGGI